MWDISKTTWRLKMTLLGMTSRRIFSWNIISWRNVQWAMYIEDVLAEKWKKVFENHLSMQWIDDFRITFKSVEVTITLYEKPNKDNRSKSYIQGRNQKKNLEFIIENHATFYRDVCKSNEVPLTSFEFKNGQKFICEKCGKYQPSGAGGTRSPPSTPHHLKHLTARFIQNGRQGPEIGQSLVNWTLRSTFAK